MLDPVSEDGGRFFRRVRPWPKPPPDDVQDAVPPQDESPVNYQMVPAPRPAGIGEGITPAEMVILRTYIRNASAEQLTIMIALVFTQIRESGFTLSSPMESVVRGQPPAWRVLDEQRREIGSVSFQEGEWKTR